MSNKSIKHKACIYTIITIILIPLFTASCRTDQFTCPEIEIADNKIPVADLEYNPEKYICYRANGIIIDGLLNESSWASADWTDDFVDIEGNKKPEPLYRTRVKMLWDDKYLYIAAELEEPHIWAKLRERDTVIFYDNDFEVFIDPDGDTHEYMEYEMNAFNTQWDLLLTKPYRDNGRVADAWNINGIQSAVKIHGTINDPTDTDNKWIIELAMPFSVLSEFGNYPSDGVQWRINFSRVNWKTEIRDDNYIKAIDISTGKAYPEFNWVWSAQGVINMHYPETWGYLQFSETESGKGNDSFIHKPDEMIKWKLRQLYYAQRSFAADNKAYCFNTEELERYGFNNPKSPICITKTLTGYQASIKSGETNDLWIIDNTGKVWAVR